MSDLVNNGSDAISKYPPGGVLEWSKWQILKDQLHFPIRCQWSLVSDQLVGAVYLNIWSGLKL